MGNFTDLHVWKKAHALTLEIYRITQRFPREGMFGLTTQMRRASSSIGANLAEGCGCKSDPELRRFVHLAKGSASEPEYHLVLSRDLKYLHENDFVTLNKALDEISRMLTSFSVDIDGGAGGYKSKKSVARDSRPATRD